jgi:hypothetical protein
MKARPQGSATSGSTSTAKQASFDDLAAYCPDLEQWPRSWRGEERDVPQGEKIVEYFRPFLRHLLNSNLSRATLRKHRDNLWVFGGEIIRRPVSLGSLRSTVTELRAGGQSMETY